MAALSEISQTHLSVLFADNVANNPIQRMPIYAEIAVTETLGGPRYSAEDLPLHNAEPENRNRIFHSFSNMVEREIFDALTEDQRMKLIDMLNELVQGLRSDDSFNSASEKQKQQRVDEIVKKAFDGLAIEIRPPERKKRLRSHPLGYIATDHVGYASFDLRNFQKSNLLLDAAFNPLSVEYDFYVYPMSKEGARLDVLAQARLTKEAVFAKFEIPTPVFLNDIKSLNLPSMQNPSLVDWYFSPGSFASKPAFLVGEDGCEQLMPAQLALHQFNFRQVVRVADTPPEWIGKIPDGAKFAYVDEYQASWYSLGHSLGEIQYSLPLAPGESVKLAVIDWSWDSLTKRDEKTKFTEDVLHQTHRDRTISETVNAVVDEWQRGGNFMAGIAGGSGAAAGGGGKGASSGNAWSLGGGYSTSSGSRKLVAENVQRLSDSFVQASSAQRELNSTVVIQARQEEKESIQTRTFTNYNHSHTLTILYYEVLRHFKLEVEWKRRSHAILVPVDAIDFSNSTNLELLTYQSLIEDALLDPKHQPAFAFLAELEAEEKFQTEFPPKIEPTIFWEGDIEFTVFEIGVRTSGEVQIEPGDTAATSELVVVNLITTNGETVERPLLETWDKAGPTWNINVAKRLNYKNEWSWFALRPRSPLKKVKWHELVGFEFVIHSDDGWEFSGLQINAFHVGGRIELVPMKEDANYTFFNNSHSHTVTYIKRPTGNRPPSPAEPLKPIQLLGKDKYQKISALRSHLVENKEYYQGLVSRRKPIEGWEEWFEGKAWNASSKYADHATPRPLATFGNKVAFQLNSGGDIGNIIDEVDINKKVETLLTLPTRGVFAEGKLGHCNISEEIDNTRFWKWEEHPIPVQAPDIAPIQAVTPQPQATNIAAGAFPAALLSIVSPSPAPDPTGLGDALKLMGTANLFRDMSGRSETADLLKKLSDNSVRFAEIAEKAMDPSAKPASATTSGSPQSSGGTSNTPGTSGTPTNSNKGPSAEELKKRAESINSLVGTANANEVRQAGSALAELYKKQSIFDQNAIASNDPNFSPAPNPSFVGNVKSKDDAIAHLEANLINPGATRFFYLSKVGKFSETLLRAKMLINDPNSLNQGFTGTCGEAAYFNVLIESVPGLFAQFFVNLLTFGQASIGKLQVTVSSALLNSDFDQIKTKYPQKTSFADWIILASLRSSENVLLPFDGDPIHFFQNLGQGTSDDELVSYFERSDFCKVGSVRSDEYSGTASGVASRKIVTPSDSEKIIFGIKTKLISGAGTGNHAIVVKSSFKTNADGTYSFDYFTWGRLVNSGAQGLKYNHNNNDLLNILSKVSLTIK